MGLRIKRQSDTRIVHACTHNVADIPNGVTVCSAELVPGTILKEGSVIGKGADGLYHVIKTASVYEAAEATATEIKVAKGSQFKAGDIVMAKKGGTAVTVSSINRDELTYDTITLSAALGALEEGAVLTQASEAGDAGAYAVTPQAMTGDHYDVESLNNHLVSAVTIGQFKESVIPPCPAELLAELKGIILI